ncbi:MAG: D-alanyl-D-alanine carboxypeptidase/D-alanyl-D-alanine-endopeptidase [Gemmatimonadota bacterium]|nr:D-alanyl-D-alanine carboxypeptidase/D-alanyl-D-alanine-endopeptidase [Gemmatimonadota bacterium]
MSTALGGSHDLIVRSSWRALDETLTRESIDGCVVDADHPTRADAHSEVEALRKKYPRLAIIAYANITGELEFYDLGELGVDGVLLADQHSAADIRALVDRALAANTAERVATALEARFGELGSRAVSWTVEHATSETSAEQFAAAMGRTPRGLVSALHRSGLPAPKTLQLWGRLLRAGEYLGRDHCTVEETAFLLGYSTASSLARAMKKNTGLTASEVAERGGLTCVHAALFSRVGHTTKKKRALKSLLVLLAGAVQIGCASVGGAGSRGSDRAAIEQVLSASPVDQVHFGILAIDAHTGRTLYSRNAHQKFVPASNQKILVTATALTLLGPDYRYRTEVWATGSLLGSLLDGDLVVLASGDPTLSDRYWDSGEAALAAIADSLRGRGLTAVGGSVFVDVSAWDSATVGPTWEVEDLRYGYGATGGAFAIDEGEIQLIVAAGAAVGSPASVRWTPTGSDDYVTSRLRTSPPDSSTRVRPSYLPESRRLVLEGNAEFGTVDTLSFAIRDPVRQATAALGRAIADAGITLEHGARVVWVDSVRVGRGCVSGAVRECPNAGLVFTLESPPLSQLIAGILKPSQNWMTEQLIRTLGAERGEQGSWSEGIDAILGFLTEQVGVDSLDVAPRDGSGLSAYNLVTPRALVRILQYMSGGANAAAFRSALARPGEENSTLERRLMDLEGRVFAKTGTISNVNSLSGYLVQNDGTEVIFSILSNGSGLSSSVVRAAIDDVARVLAR